MLSARPHIYKDATERATYALFEKLVKEKDFYCIPSLLAGSIGGIKGMKAERNGVYMASFQDVYIKKLQNLNELKTLYPEENFIFVGDNGQADGMACKIYNNDGIQDIQQKNIEHIFVYTRMSDI
ncbi:hypothetical protein SARC_03831 [Sphaeroforma arctica JP610]|uniref:Phosphatidate phosphatase APP1 catalytic domain-containing protein n=1 Tax=Sphaeroforma arctica JP610 TaxID=667725 RepID=A0A0L0G4B4_9EUKA|nr:hypothetical protein SARC_03831 [Sphaeroforma arctica JP610]KNC83937.1 hypothetical protein SARC_03831 [Sphaeroforma arctica JP610]|eukprot:XP_014157839.1 hypothetical protein SARC_03831 [Sphaeroforma arctica JP610]